MSLDTLKNFGKGFIWTIKNFVSSNSSRGHIEYVYKLCSSDFVVPWFKFIVAKNTPNFHMNPSWTDVITTATKYQQNVWILMM